MSKTKRNIDEYTESYVTFYPLIFSAVYTKIGNRDETKDLCQEIFLIYFQKFDEVENARKWLLGTMRNVVLQYYQRKGKNNVNIDDVFEDISLTYVNGFRDTRIILSEALENIECDEKDRMVLDLIATHNFTYGKVAELLGLTHRQVEYKYSQLVKKVSDYLNNKGIKDIQELL